MKLTFDHYIDSTAPKDREGFENWLIDQLERQHKQREKTLRDALSFYAKHEHYPLPIKTLRNFEVTKDGGELARKALAATQEVKP